MIMGWKTVHRLMLDGHRLFWSNIGPWMLNPADGSSRSVHLASARAIYRRKLVVKVEGLELVLKGGQP